MEPVLFGNSVFSNERINMSFFTVNKVATLISFKDLKMGDAFFYNQKEFVKINDTCGLCLDETEELNIIEVPANTDLKVQKTGVANISIKVTRPS